MTKKMKKRAGIILYPVYFYLIQYTVHSSSVS